MDQNRLVNELVKAGSHFLEEFGKTYPIAVAFWMKEKEGFDPFWIRLRTMDERIVHFALENQRRNPSLTMIFDVPGYYGVEVDAMYLYPAVTTAAA